MKGLLNLKLSLRLLVKTYSFVNPVFQKRCAVYFRVMVCPRRQNKASCKTCIWFSKADALTTSHTTEQSR